MYAYCTERYIHCIYSTYILYRSVCPLVVQSCTVQDENVDPLTPRKCTILNGNFVLNLHGIFQEHNPGIKPELPVTSSLTLITVTSSLICSQYTSVGTVTRLWAGTVCG
jgi:hypothetical protein